MVGIYSSNPACGHSNKHPQVFTTDYTFSPVVAVIHLFHVTPPKPSTSWWTICAVRVVTKGLVLTMNADWHQCQSAFTSVCSSALHFGFNNPEIPVKTEAVLISLWLMISSVVDQWNAHAPLSRASHRCDYDSKNSICPSRNKVTQLQNNRLPLRDLPNAGNPI